MDILFAIILILIALFVLLCVCVAKKAHEKPLPPEIEEQPNYYDRMRITKKIMKK